MMLQYMQQAIEMAQKSVMVGGGPFGAVIVQNDQVIAAEHNQVTLTCDPTAHAEVVAIRAACRQLGRFNLADCQLYTSCFPCPMCIGAIYWAHVGQVFYASTALDAAAAGFDDQFIYEELALPLVQRQIPLIQLAPSAAGSEFALWRVKLDRIDY